MSFVRRINRWRFVVCFGIGAVVSILLSLAGPVVPFAVISNRSGCPTLNCTNCNYDLTGLIAAGGALLRCPECGQLEPRTPRRRPALLWRSCVGFVLLSSLCVAVWFGWFHHLLYPLAQHIAPIKGWHVLYLYLFSLVPLAISTMHWESYRRLPDEPPHYVTKALWVLAISIAMPVASCFSYYATLR